MDRFYEKIIGSRLNEERQMLFLMGPRQVGKTTVGQRVGAARRHHVYLNWDNVDQQGLVLEGPAGLAEALGLDHLRAEKPLLILDEIHKFDGWRTLLKGFFDTYGKEADILVTGSARLSVFNASGESLMGRYFGYRLHPLSLAELTDPRVPEEPGSRLPAAVDDGTWDALLRFGGFPEPLLRGEERFANRWRRLRQQQLVREELRDLTRIQEVGKVQVLAQLLIQRAGQLTGYTALADGVKASIDSIKRWITTLEHLYFCFLIRPWFNNVARSLRKEPKIYLWDWSSVQDPGARFENLVASALLKACHFWTDDGYGDFGLHFVRDKEKREVDFLVSRDGEPWLLVETKAGQTTHLPKSFHHHRAQLAPPHAFLVSRDLPYVDSDVFALERPRIVPARTFLSQLV